MIKYNIFISSTYKDLLPHRKRIHDSILKNGHFPIAMENFTASNKEQWEIIKPLIDSCDYFVLLIGFNYGSIDKDENISFTEKEYNYAISINKPILSFILDNSLSLNKKIKYKKKLDLFKKKVLKNNKLAQYCKDKNTISSDVIIALNNEYKINPQSGWIRAKNYQNIKQKYDLLESEYNRIINPTDFSNLFNFNDKISLTGLNSNYQPWNACTTFKDIFLIISEYIDKHQIESIIFFMLAQKLEFDKEYPEFTISIDNESKIKIKNTFIRLKLIRCYKHKNSGKNIKYWELTKKGEEYLLSL